MSTVKCHTSPHLDGVVHGFFTRRGGVSEGIYDSLNVGLGSSDNRAAILQNRDLVRDALNADHLQTARQTHSAKTCFLARWRETVIADAMVTKTPGLAIGTLAADCAPVLLADVAHGVIGAAHSGWRGAFDGIIASVVKTMCDYGATRSTIKAVIGPCISQTAYEVGAEFVARFETHYADDIDLFAASQKTGHAMFDLPGFVTRQLGRMDVEASALNLCTYSQESDFFSYRRTTHRNEADYGRQISAICLPQ